MFGHRNQNQSSNKFQTSMSSKKIKPVAEKPYEEPDEHMVNKQVADKTNQAKTDRKQGYAEGRERAEELYSRDVQGLDPVKRQAMQYEANKGIQRSQQQANRKLLGDQATRGIMGKSGVGYSQQRDLQRMAMDANAGVHRDLDKLDADQRNKNRAAMFGIEQGEASQNQLDKQMALDEIRLGDERKRQRQFDDQFYKQFMRL